MKTLNFFIGGIVLVFALQLVSCLDVVNNSSQQASNCLNDSRNIMLEMSFKGFNVLRVNATLKEAQSFYDSQLILMEKGKNSDFSKVMDYCNQISILKRDAFLSKDSFEGLMKFYNDSITSAMNSSSIDVIIAEIRSEIANERYEKVLDLVEKAYSEIALVTSSYTTLNIFVDATSAGIKRFILKRWKIVTAVLAITLILYFSYRKKIMSAFINFKIDRLRIRRKTLKDLTMKTQKDYFQYGSIPEEEYNIKTKKFAELIRDIDRQIPLFQEELAKLGKNGLTKF